MFNEISIPHDVRELPSLNEKGKHDSPRPIPRAPRPWHGAFAVLLNGAFGLTGPSLFRQQAVQCQCGDAMGTILIAAPLSRWALVALATTLGASLIALLVFGYYTRRETVTGLLVPNMGVLTLTAPSAGTVAQIHVHDGQPVKKGDVLLELSTDRDSLEFGQAHAVVSEALDAQRQRLQADLANQTALTTLQGDTLRSKIALLRSQMAQLNGQLALQQEQVSNNQNLLDRIQPLASKGYVSVFQIQQQQGALLDAQAQYKTLKRQQLDTQQQIDSTQHQLTQLPLDDATKRNDTERQLATITQSLAQNEIERAIVLRAPSDGVVSAVLLKPGQMASPGQSLVSILPAGSVLQAQLLVPSRAVGFMTSGNLVVLRYQAFPYQKFGQQYGRIVDISRSALSPSEVNLITGQQAQGPLYRVTVGLDRQQVMAFGKPEPVKPGMALDADILLERRTLLEWVFEPLYGLGHHLAGGSNHG